MIKKMLRGFLLGLLMAVAVFYMSAMVFGLYALAKQIVVRIAS